MKIVTYHVDAFTDKLFSGNPASVCILENWLPDNILQKIAAENNLPATVFLVREENTFHIRWFAPEYEIDLCGHGTLAAGFVIFNIIEAEWSSVTFNHPVIGPLQIQRNYTSVILDFPTKYVDKYESSSILLDGLGIKPIETYQFKNERILAIFNTEDEIRQLKPNIQLLKQLNHRGIIVTAPGKDIDFVSRVFYPKKSIFEDPVTGSSYCLLVPYWANQLKKTKFQAFQLSERGGKVVCELQKDRVLLQGNAVIFKQGIINAI